MGIIYIYRAGSSEARENCLEIWGKYVLTSTGITDWHSWCISQIKNSRIIILTTVFLCRYICILCYALHIIIQAFEWDSNYLPLQKLMKFSLVCFWIFSDTAFHILFHVSVNISERNDPRFDWYISMYCQLSFNLFKYVKKIMRF